MKLFKTHWTFILCAFLLGVQYFTSEIHQQYKSPIQPAPKYQYFLPHDEIKMTKQWYVKGLVEEINWVLTAIALLIIVIRLKAPELIILTAMEWGVYRSVDLIWWLHNYKTYRYDYALLVALILILILRYAYMYGKGRT